MSNVMDKDLMDDCTDESDEDGGELEVMGRIKL